MTGDNDDQDYELNLQNKRTGRRHTCKKMCQFQNNKEEITMNYRNLISILNSLGFVLIGQSISGFVGDGDKPLVGANVIVEGTELGGVSDERWKIIVID